ncbi:unnamed protein product, partial [Effrenium voratum]
VQAVPMPWEADWCSLHIVTKTRPAYRRVYNPGETLGVVVKQYKVDIFGNADVPLAFFAQDQEVHESLMLAELPQAAPRVVVLTATLPSEARCIRMAQLLVDHPEFFQEHQQKGEITKLAFCQAIFALTGDVDLQMDPAGVWEMAVGSAAGMSQDTYQTTMCSYECQVDNATLTETVEHDSPVVAKVNRGCCVQVQSKPVQQGDRVRAEAQCGSHTGWLTLAAGERQLFCRSFAFLERDAQDGVPEASDLTQELSNVIDEQDGLIDEALGVQVKDEEDANVEQALPARKGKGKAKEGSRGGAAFGVRKQMIEKDIARLQKTTNLLVPRAAFGRLVRELLDQLSEEKLKMSAGAVQVLQECAENHITNTMSRLNVLAQHRKAVTVSPKDLAVLQRLQS